MIIACYYYGIELVLKLSNLFKFIFLILQKNPNMLTKLQTCIASFYIVFTVVVRVMEIR